MGVAGPRQPSLIQALRWTFRPERLLRECWERYGDTFTLQVSPGERMVLLANPADVKAIFTAGPNVAAAGEGRGELEPMFGRHSLLLVDGAAHLRDRKVLLPSFHGDRLARYRELIGQIAEREIASWPVGKPFALQRAMQAITLEVILRVVYGMEEGEHMQTMRDAIERLLEATASPFAGLVVARGGLLHRVGARAFRTLRGGVAELILDEIARHRSDPNLAERDDVLSLLVQARYDDGEAMSDEQILDQLVTLLIAGHETTATGLAWTWVLLWRNPEALERVSEDDAYARAAVKEALRLRPPLPLVDRTLKQPFEIGGRELPAGTVVAPCIYLVHRRPDLYPEPDAFRPERFLDGGAPDTYSWLPFGGGVRRCIGASFATMEMEIVLAMTAQRARIRAASPRAERVRRRSIVLAPSRGARAVLTERLA